MLPMMLREYIHPQDEEIKRFADELQLHGQTEELVVAKLFVWFDSCISYTRLDAPYDPLQRSDIDVLRLHSGTCGDYSNLIVSVLISLGYKAVYAYLKIDLYGNPQDHICAAIWSDSRWKLIDATLPYRKWHGFDCPHKEYEILTPQEFITKMKAEEIYCTEKALAWGNERYAGLLYAPWIHEEVILNEPDVLETVFFLLIYENPQEYSIYVNYFVYNVDYASTPVMCTISGDQVLFRFSIHHTENIWDEAQWSSEFLIHDVPCEYQGARLESTVQLISKMIPRIEKITREV